MATANRHACATCGRPTPWSELDAKPANMATWLARAGGDQIEALCIAADHGAQFTRFECRACYGAGFVENDDAT